MSYWFPMGAEGILIHISWPMRRFAMATLGAVAFLGAGLLSTPAAAQCPPNKAYRSPVKGDTVANCLDDFDPKLTFTIKGKGKTKEAAIKDLETQRDKKLEELEKELKCSEKRCPVNDQGLGDDDGRTCRFDWAETGQPEVNEITRKLHIHRQQRKRFEAVQTFEVGCFCIGRSDKKNEDK